METPAGVDVGSMPEEEGPAAPSSVFPRQGGSSPNRKDSSYGQDEEASSPSSTKEEKMGPTSSGDGPQGTKGEENTQEKGEETAGRLLEEFLRRVTPQQLLEHMKLFGYFDHLRSALAKELLQSGEQTRLLDRTRAIVESTRAHVHAPPFDPGMTTTKRLQQRKALLSRILDELRRTPLHKEIEKGIQGIVKDPSFYELAQRQINEAVSSMQSGKGNETPPPLGVASASAGRDKPKESIWDIKVGRKDSSQLLNEMLGVGRKKEISKRKRESGKEGAADTRDSPTDSLSRKHNLEEKSEDRDTKRQKLAEDGSDAADSAPHRESPDANVKRKKPGVVVGDERKDYTSSSEDEDSDEDEASTDSDSLTSPDLSTQSDMSSESESDSDEDEDSQESSHDEEDTTPSSRSDAMDLEEEEEVNVDTDEDGRKSRRASVSIRKQERSSSHSARHLRRRTVRVGSSSEEEDDEESDVDVETVQHDERKSSLSSRRRREGLRGSSDSDVRQRAGRRASSRPTEEEDAALARRLAEQESARLYSLRRRTPRGK